SKSFGLAGLRFGFLISNPANIAYFEKIISPSYSVNRFAAAAAIACIQDKHYFDAYVEEVILGRTLFTESMRTLGYKTYPSQANFVLTDFGTDKESIQMRLLKNKILVREKEGKLRITIGTIEQTRRLIAVIQNEKKALLFDMDGVLVDETLSY